MEIAKVTSKGQITVPKEVRKQLELEAGSKIVFIRVGDDLVVRNADTQIDRERSNQIKNRVLAEISARYNLEFPIQTDQSKPIGQLLDEIREGFAGVAEEQGWETEQDVTDYIKSTRNGDES